MLRRLDQVPAWSYPLARHLFARERHALALARDLDVGPKLLWAGRQALVRGFIDGVALHLAKPHGDLAYFRSAKLALRKLHRAGICHNDLAKEQNWLRRQRRPGLCHRFPARRLLQDAAAGCSGSRPMRTCGIC